ncbi:hypothetical protein CHX26_00625 [Porphyrobacter sp. HT-58-2]|uniref:sugar transferase n=1 Tax=Porphyrobacter sp. HT-58-2 TaxID=2023229 RepID=UPI000CDCB32C|nr:sugar transferase [Porphyrobacter sp. HT-58-2]AUX68213.1 hypothetical protein CHX26_00625 [Porphyrobacter sp. HT-58-2]
MKEVVVALLIAFLAFEINAWYPRLLSQIVIFATRRLPPRQRERYREEWSAHLCETPGAIVKLWQAVGFVWASGGMFPRWRRGIAHIRFIRRCEAAERLTQRALDLVFATGTLIALAPLLFFVTITLKISGPVFERRRHVRVDGVCFEELRFCTVGGESKSSDWHLRLRYFLRRTAISELPLLLNIFRADMTFVATRNAPTQMKQVKPSLLEMRDVTMRARNRRHRSIMHTIAITAGLYITAIGAAAKSLLLYNDE